MYDYKTDIERLKDPRNIREAVYASSPYVLKTTFDDDVIVRRLIDAGNEVVPLIREELKSNFAELPEITLACFAYILQKVNAASAEQVLKPLFVRAAEKPGPFFVNFAAHAIRKSKQLPVSTEKMSLTKAELLETLKAVQDEKPKPKKDKEV
ncbi:MAG: hypothetical protein JSU94_20705 [Phycisphaerales bacterium]|nr:MAG: hypothetical protein JSU94_20705 [Phycisphaerales bacterium]